MCIPTAALNKLLPAPPHPPGARRQRLRPCCGLVGSGGGDVRDDVWQTAFLQPGPREAV